MSVQTAAIIFLAVITVCYLFNKFGRGLAGIILILCMIGLGVWALVHSFTAFSTRTLVATVKASQVSNASHEMTVDLTAYDGYGNPTHTSYELGGDRWFLQAQVVEMQPWVLLLGMKSGYHLSRIEGQYDGSLANSTPVSLGSWSFFNGLENNVRMFFPVVKSAYSSAVIDPADGRVYNIYADPQGDLVSERG